VFDPERDEDQGVRPFIRRLLTVAVISALGCIALWPSVAEFATGPDHQTGCLPIRDGWHADRSAPTAADAAAVTAALPPIPTAAQRNDPAFMARWRVAWQAGQANPAVVQAYSYQDWASSTGMCIRASRHRLILSGIGLGALIAVTSGISIVRRTRTRKNLRPIPGELAGI